MASHFQVRFGMTAMRKGFITVHQLMEAIAIQVREDVEGKPHRFVGKILSDLGYMTPSQVGQVLRDIAAGRR
jgi:hypothetical protein